MPSSPRPFRREDPAGNTPPTRAWWMMQKMTDLGLRPWFPPTDIRRGLGVRWTFRPPDAARADHAGRRCTATGSTTCLCSDQQQMALCAKPGESDVPGARAGRGHRLRPSVCGHAWARRQPGARGPRGGARRRPQSADLHSPHLLSRPRGRPHHRPVDQQEGVPHNGDYPLSTTPPIASSSTCAPLSPSGMTNRSS